MVNNEIDIMHKWYLNRPIASAGSLALTEAGSIAVLDFSIDYSHGYPHFNIRVRAGASGVEPRGRGVQYILGEQHSINLFQPGSISI